MANISDSNTTRIATGTRDKCVQVWLFDSTTHQLNGVSLKAYGDGKGIIPKALAFDANKEQDLYVFGLHDGGL